MKVMLFRDDFHDTILVKSVFYVKMLSLCTLPLNQRHNCNYCFTYFASAISHGAGTPELPLRYTVLTRELK